MLLKIGHPSVMMQLMVDLPSDQMSLVQFRAGLFRTLCISFQQAELLAICPIAQCSPSITYCSQLNRLPYGEGE